MMSPLNSAEAQRETPGGNGGYVPEFSLYMLRCTVMEGQSVAQADIHIGVRADCEVPHRSPFRGVLSFVKVG